jgi:amino acid transporter
MGWNYAMQWLIVLPLEIVAASLTLQYWKLTTSPLLFVAIFWCVTAFINFFGVRGYAEAEFFYGAIKVTAVILFIILGIIINLGGAPDHKYYGSETWRNPGAVHNGFKGFCAMFVNAAFAFAGTELVGLAAAETAHPRKVLPDATKQVVWRIIIFYFVSLLIVGFLVPYDSDQLLGHGVNTSAFVIAISNAGITGLPDFMNFIILISTLSVGNSAVYGASRVLLALVDYGQAPKILGYVDRAGRPMVAVILCLLLGLIAFVGSDPIASALTFNWLLAISGLSSLFTWGSILFCHIRFRAAWKLQGRTLEELPFAAAGGVLGSWFGLMLNTAALGATFYTALFPIGGTLGSDDGGKPDPEIFFLTYLAALVVVVFWAAYMIWGWRQNGLWHVPLDKIDLVAGMKNFPSLELLR